jgi:phenylalanyl-tRNA synthetase beta chain
MKLSYNWLKELVSFDCSPAELAQALTSVGIEVASLETKSVPDKILAGQVLTCEKHPNADKLHVTTVDVGGEKPLNIVCGAPNVKAGMRVACAVVGCVIGPDFVIKKAKLRGVESEGMLCSERELGISDDHSGLMDLPAECAVGRSLKEFFPDDTIIEIELTPNRGDCLSILGVAREISAKLRLPLNPIAKRPADGGESINTAISVTIENPAMCPRYMGRLVRGVKIGESPLWLKQRLRACGIRPISNVVDVTNYILLLYGQPMHAFDYNRIKGQKIIVKNAAGPQKFATLDNCERSLTPADLLICDGERPVAIAGVMGGAGSEISEQTTDVFLECAYFDPVGIRKTSKRLELSTDSSYRFERGVDPDEGLADALDTAAALVKEVAGGEVAQGLIDAHPKKLEQRRICLRPAQASRLLGIPVDRQMCIDTLAALNVTLIDQTNDCLTFTAPLYRHDLEIEADLIEEVGRMYGYDNIPTKLTAAITIGKRRNPVDSLLDTLRKALAFSGLRETRTNSMTSEKRVKLLTPTIEPVAIRNPLNPDMALLRTTLLGSLLEVTTYNLNRKNSNNRFFEISKTFSRNPDPQAPLPRERDVVAILIEGNYLPQSWNAPAAGVNFWILKGLLEELAAHLGLQGFSYAAMTEKSSYFDTECAAVSWQDGIQGTMGKVKAEILKAFDIKSDVYYAELDITGLLQKQLPQARYTALPRVPAVERDFAFVMAEDILSSEIAAEIAAVSELVKSVAPFDVYHGEKLGAGLKSIAYSVHLRAADRTLNDKEADEVSKQIIARVQQKFNATLRS